MKVVNVSYGIASRYDDLIEINKNLPKKLKNRVLRHEKSHTNGSYKLKDWKVDYNAKNPYFWQTIFFSIRNPAAFIGFMPIMYSYYLKRWTFNTTSLFPMALYCAIWITAVKILFSIPIFNAFMTFFNVLVTINILLLIYTDRHIRINLLRY